MSSTATKTEKGNRPADSAVITFFFKGAGSKRVLWLPFLPRVGEYIRHNDRLWKVAAVVFSPAPSVYVESVCDQLADRFESAWAIWDLPLKLLSNSEPDGKA